MRVHKLWLLVPIFLLRRAQSDCTGCRDNFDCTCPNDPLGCYNTFQCSQITACNNCCSGQGKMVFDQAPLGHCDCDAGYTGNYCQNNTIQCLDDNPCQGANSTSWDPNYCVIKDNAKYCCCGGQPGAMCQTATDCPAPQTPAPTTRSPTALHPTTLHPTTLHPTTHMPTLTTSPTTASPHGSSGSGLSVGSISAISTACVLVLMIVSYFIYSYWKNRGKNNDTTAGGPMRSDALLWTSDEDLTKPPCPPARPSDASTSTRGSFLGYFGLDQSKSSIKESK